MQFFFFLPKSFFCLIVELAPGSKFPGGRNPAANHPAHPTEGRQGRRPRGYTWEGGLFVVWGGGGGGETTTSQVSTCRTMTVRSWRFYTVAREGGPFVLLGCVGWRLYAGMYRYNPNRLLFLGESADCFP